MGVKKYSVQGVGGAVVGGGYKKLGSNFFTAIQRAQRALQVAEGHQPYAGARSRHL